MDNDIKQRIIQKAAELFPVYGFSKVTLDELSEELGISKKTIYRYFAGKDEIADAVYRWMVLSVKERLEEIMKEPIDYLDRLYMLCEFIGQFLSRMHKPAQKDLIKHRPDLWKKIELYRKQEVFPIFESVLDEGVRLGILRRDIRKDLSLLIITSTVEGVLTPEVLVHKPFSAEDAFRGIIDIFFNGILTDKARAYYRKRTPVKKSEGPHENS